MPPPRYPAESEIMSGLSQIDSEYLRGLGVPSRALQCCEPDFLVISPSKTGTTWLSKNLSSHPEIYIPPIKEIQYFNVYWREFDINWYLRHFQDAGGRRKGEATPYAGLPQYVVRSIKQRLPRLKLIFLMRDPIERAWSQAKHDFRYKQGVFSSYTGSFEEIPDQKFIQHFSDLHNINIGDYLLCLRRWLSCFDREQIYLGFFESIKTDPEALLRQVLDHIDVKSDVDLSSFPILERILPGSEEEVPVRLKPYLKAIYGEKTRELLGFLKEQFQISPPSEWDTTAAAAEHDPLLLETDYKGYQLLLYSSKFYASLSRHGDLVVEKDDRTPRGNLADSECFVGHSLDEVKDCVDRLVFEPDRESHTVRVYLSFLDDLFSRVSMQLENYSGFSVFFFRHKFYALSQDLGPIDPALLAEHILLDYQVNGRCYVAESQHEIHKVLDLHFSPVIVLESYERFNVVKFEGKFFGFAQSLGAVDIAQLDVCALESYEASGHAVVASSVEEARRWIDDHTVEIVPVLVLEGYGGFNIVRYREKHYGLAQTLGALDVTRLDEQTLGMFEATGQVLSASSLAQVKRRIDDQVIETVPALVYEGYWGFNIVRYREKYYGLIQTLGPLDVTQLDEQTLKIHEAAGQVLAASTLEEAQLRITNHAVETVPMLVLEGYMEFNVLRYKKNYLGVAQSLGAVDLTTTDQQTLDIYQRQGKCVIAGSLGMVKYLIDRMPEIP